MSWVSVGEVVVKAALRGERKGERKGERAADSNVA